MVFKPNYNQQRAERDRLKQAKKEAKLQEKLAAKVERKSEPDTASNADGEPLDQNG